MFRIQILPLNRKSTPFFGLLMALILSFCLTAVTLAQDETAEPTESAGEQPPILKLLALVPRGIPFADGNLIGFSDFRAAAATRNGATDYESWADFQTDLDAGEIGPNLLLQSLPLSGFLNGQYLFSAGPQIPTVVGFDFFDIDTALTVGVPPVQLSLYQGDFDVDRIDAALTSNGFTSGTLDDFPYWCSEDGCDAGLEQDIANRNPANLFGGDLGRRFPVVLLDDVLVSSGGETQVELAAATYQDEIDSLADDPDFQTAVAAMYGGLGTGLLDARPLLRQASFIPADALLVSLGDPAALLNMSPEQLEALQERLTEDLPDAEPLPVYRLAAITDFGNSDNQFAEVILVYSDAADAQIAAEIVPQRLASMTSLATTQPLLELFADRGAELPDPVVYTDEATGQSATVFTFQYPPAQETDENGMIIQSGLVYQLLLNMVYRRDMLWLASEITLPEVE